MKQYDIKHIKNRRVYEKWKIKNSFTKKLPSSHKKKKSICKRSLGYT